MLGDKSAALETLRQQITAIETNPALKDSGDVAIPDGFLATPRGSLHEVFADSLIGADGGLVVPDRAHFQRAHDATIERLAKEGLI